MLDQLGNRIGCSFSGVEDYIAIFGEYEYEPNIDKDIENIVSNPGGRFVFVKYVCGTIVETGDISSYSEHFGAMGKVMTRDDVISLYVDVCTGVGNARGPWRVQFAKAFAHLITMDDLDLTQ